MVILAFWKLHFMGLEFNGALDDIQRYMFGVLNENFSPETSHDYRKIPFNFIFDTRNKITKSALSWTFKNPFFDTNSGSQISWNSRNLAKNF
jgi:hypothetical protein